MALAKSARVERVLIVFGPDGTLKGAHQEREEIISEDGAILSQRQLPPEPLTPGALAALMPEQAVLIAQVAVLQEVLATVTNDRDIKSAALAESERVSMDRAARIDALSAEIARMQTERVPL